MHQATPVWCPRERAAANKGLPRERVAPYGTSRPGLCYAVVETSTKQEENDMRPDTDRPTHRMSRRTSISSAITVMGLLLGLAAVALLYADIAALAQAQPTSPKLYVFNVGSLKSRDPKPLLDRGVTITDMSVTAYLIVHPRGTLLWDSGTIPDELVKPGGTTVERATVHKTLSGQLAEIGYKAADITYVALSH